MRKLIIILLVSLFLNGCVVRTTKTYLKTPPNSTGILIEETSEVIWCWQKIFLNNY